MNFITDISSFELIKKISSFDDDTRKEILGNNEIKDKLRIEVFVEASQNPKEYCRVLCDCLSVDELLTLFNGDYLSERFNDGGKEEIEFIFYASLYEKDKNKTLRYTLIDDKFFDKFFSVSSKVCNSLVGIDYEILLKIIYKFEEKRFPYDNCFKFSIKDQYKLLNESISDDILVWLFATFDKEVISFFFQNVPSAKRILSKIDVVKLANNGIIFGDDVVHSDEFFERLKTDSLISFRNNINIIEKRNVSIVIEEKVKKYYDGLLKRYNKDTGMFYEYEKLLSDEFSFGNDYILNRDIIINFKKIYDNCYLDAENLQKNKVDFLRKYTNQKISEIVVDGLFQDTIYNVFLNIKEMLRYNDLLNENDRVLDKDRVLFYQRILDIDRISCEDKIKLYYQLRDKNVSLMFYTDLRKLKDLSYKNIRKDVIKLNEHSDYKSSSLSLKYGVEVYDLRDKEYIMLVRSMESFSEKCSHRRDCYTLISNENTQMYNFKGCFFYGYDDFDENYILHLLEKDAGSKDVLNDDLSVASKYVNRIATSRQIINSLNGHNEVQIINKKCDDDDLYYALKPSYLIALDEINSELIEESKKLGIPIVLIKNKKLENGRNDLDFNYLLDSYTTNDLFFIEDERRKYR